MHGGVYAINSTETLVGDVKTFEGTGTIACPVQHEDGTVTPETKINLKPDRELVVSYQLVLLNRHALNVVREMVEETLHLGDRGAIEPPLLDREFADEGSFPVVLGVLSGREDGTPKGRLSALSLCLGIARQL